MGVLNNPLRSIYRADGVEFEFEATRWYAAQRRTKSSLARTFLQEIVYSYIPNNDSFCVYVIILALTIGHEDHTRSRSQLIRILFDVRKKTDGWR